jgi:HEAT repeat protein
LRDSHQEYERRKVQPLVVMAQHPFQLKRPRAVHKDWCWPKEIPAGVVFDPVSTVSATYGVAFQTRFRREQGPWSGRPAIFVIDPGGVLRYTDSQPELDLREVDFFPVLDDLEKQRRLITDLGGQEGLGEAARIALAPLGAGSKSAIPALVRALKDESAQVRAGAAAALDWLAPRAQAAIPPLGEALQDSDRRVRRLSRLALGRMGPEAGTAARALAKGLVDQDAGVRTAAAGALQQIGAAAAPGVIQALKKDRDQRVRAAAAAALPGLQAEGATQQQVLAALVGALKEDEAVVRVAAAYALGATRTKAPDAVAALRKALEDRDGSVRKAAAAALQHIDPEAAGKGGR